MASEHNHIAAFLEELQLFNGLNEDQVEQVAERLKEYKLGAGEQLFSQGDQGENFYILLRGGVRVWRMEYQEEVELAILEPGDYFGEEELLFYHPRVASITALENTTLLYLDNQDFEWLINNFPQVKPNLDAIAETHQRARHLHFDWLGEGEVIHLILQRHVAHLIFNLIKPFALLIPGIMAAVLIYYTPTQATQLFASIAAGIFLSGAILWTIWYVIDWRNDHFIVTNQRVVWSEQVLLQSASQHEAPMTTIQSVNTQTSLLGRALDYGNVNVRTYTGSMLMENVKTPNLMKGRIEELILRARKKTQRSKTESIRFSIRKSLGYTADDEEDINESPIPLPPPEEKQHGFGLFKTREVHGDTFTYHKHWFSLLRNTGVTLLIFFGISIAAVALIWRGVTTGNYPPPNTVLLFASVALAVPFLILVYQYMDWRNDLYRVSKDSIIDREKKPFSTEITKSAPLKNILSLKHEKRGILGMLMNFGEVNINVGDTTLTFRSVPNPSQVQQDIFYRMEKLKRQEEFEEDEEDRSRMTEWIKTYHEVQESEENSG